MTTATTLMAAPATTGGWIAFSSGSRVLVVGASADDASVAALWSALGEPDAQQLVLDRLTSSGISATPPFALLDFTTGLRVIVRGDVTVTVTHPGGDEQLSGRGVSTWTERAFDSAADVALVVTNAVAADVPSLPLAAGAAWVAALTIGAVAARVEAQPVVSQPVVAPPAVAEPVVAPPAVAEPVEIDIEATVTEAPVDAPPVDTPTVAMDELETSPEGYDYLFGDTMYRSVADAAVRDEVEPEAEAGESDAGEATNGEPANDQTATDDAAGGDHDGHTVLTSDIAKLRGRRKSKTAGDAPPPAPESPVVSLVLADGTREPLSQPILVGRSPSVSQVSGGKMPKLITVGGADQDISRTHVRFVLEGGTVVVTDLHSRNGTTIAMPGKEPQKLRAGEPTSVIVGTVVDLGGGVTFTVDEA